MEIEKFKALAEEYASFTDFIENKDILDLVPNEYRSPFIDALMAGFKMKNSFAALEKAEELANSLDAATGDIFFILKHFLQLYKVLKGIEDGSNLVAETVEVIDNIRSYQELVFLRDHIEFRIDAYLKNLSKSNSPAFSRSWKDKSCPACGSLNDMYNISCKTCGWEPAE